MELNTQSKHSELKEGQEAVGVWSLVMGLSLTSADKLQLLTHAYMNIKQLLEKLNPLDCCRHTNLVQKTVPGASRTNRMDAATLDCFYLYLPYRMSAFVLGCFHSCPV